MSVCVQINQARYNMLEFYMCNVFNNGQTSFTPTDYFKTHERGINILIQPSVNVKLFKSVIMIRFFKR